MSAIGVLVARVVGSVGGPVVTGAVIAGGVAIGALGGGLFASGGGQQASSAGQLAVYPCPNTGPVLLTIEAGQQVLATGRTADSTWLRIHYPSPGRGEAWVPAGPLTVEGAVSSLPVAECLPELAIAPPSVVPAESFTVAQNNPPSAPPATATPTPTATTGPTATPNVRPVVSSLTASTGQVSFDTGGYCPNAVKQVTFRVRATDAGGVAGVSLFWRKPGAGSFAETAMTRVSGTASNGTWQATLDTTANSINKAGSLAYYAQAKDGAGASRRIPVATTNAIQVKVCANTGPVISGATSSSGATLYEDPFGVSQCQTASNITAVIKDTDGVASATLFYRRPGAAAWSSKPMNNTTIKGRWYANLDTLGDKITITSPPSGTLRWYIKAADAKGASSQGVQHTITIRRCDSEAGFKVNQPDPSYTFCPQPPQNTTSVRLAWTLSISDPDGLTGLSLTYDVSDKQTGNSRTQTIRVSGAGPRFRVLSAPLDGNSFYGSNQLAWTVTTTDRYGGKTSVTTSTKVTISVC